MSDGPFEELADRLVVPARSGVYLTRSEIVLLARLEDASLRYGERRRMLVDVLRSARGPAELGATVERLRAMVRDSLASFRELVSEFPAAGPALGPWIARAERTERGLSELIEDLAADDPAGR